MSIKLIFKLNAIGHHLINGHGANGQKEFTLEAGGDLDVSDQILACFKDTEFNASSIIYDGEGDTFESPFTVKISTTPINVIEKLMQIGGHPDVKAAINNQTYIGIGTIAPQVK